MLSTLKTILEPKNLLSVATVLGVKLKLELPVLAPEFCHFTFYQIIRLERVRDGRHYLSEDLGAQKGFKITTKEFFTRNFLVISATHILIVTVSLTTEEERSEAATPAALNGFANGLLTMLVAL